MKSITKTFALVGTMAGISALTAAGAIQMMNRQQPADDTTASAAYTWDALATSADGETPVVRTASRLASAAASGLDFTTAAERTVNAVVGITNKQIRQQVQQPMMNDPFFEFFFGQRGGQYQQQPQSKDPVPTGAGSGVIISADGYIVTNNHVVKGADELTVTLNDQREFTARLVGTDPATDIALLKVEATDLPTIEFGSSDDLKIGEWVLAVGNPFNLTSTVTAGIVSAKGRSLSSGGRVGIESFIQTDAAVNPGNSGGALVNTAGELVGINTAIYSETGNYAGYSFAVPSSIVSKVVTDLRQYGTVQRALLGITGGTVTAELADKEHLSVSEGVWVSGVMDEGAASEAGVEKGDVIISVGGTGVKTMAQLQEQVARFRPGDKTSVTVNRKGAEKTFHVTFRNDKGNTEIVTRSGVDALGCTLKNLSSEELRRYGVRSGVLVSKVEQGGAIARSGIREGYLIVKVNDQPVKSDKDIEKIVENLQTNRSADQEPVLFTIGLYPNGRQAFYAVDLSK